MTLGLLMMLLLGVEASDRSQRIEQVFNELRVDRMEILDDFYHPEVEFLDPLGEHNGIQAVKDYYTNLYDSVEEIRFDFTRETVQGDVHVAEWIMTLKTKNSLNGGEPFDLVGNSVIVFDPNSNKVIYHRDYFDMGAFIYERLPVIGWIIREIKDRLR